MPSGAAGGAGGTGLGLGGLGTLTRLTEAIPAVRSCFAVIRIRYEPAASPVLDTMILCTLPALRVPSFSVFTAEPLAFSSCRRTSLTASFEAIRKLTVAVSVGRDTVNALRWGREASPCTLGVSP